MVSVVLSWERNLNGAMTCGAGVCLGASLNGHVSSARLPWTKPDLKYFLYFMFSFEYFC